MFIGRFIILSNTLRFHKTEKGQLLYALEIKNHIPICVHPFVYSHITIGLSSSRVTWFSKFKKWIKVRPMSSYGFLEYRFFDAKDDELVI